MAGSPLYGKDIQAQTIALIASGRDTRREKRSMHHAPLPQGRRLARERLATAAWLDLAAIAQFDRDIPLPDLRHDIAQCERQGEMCTMDAVRCWRVFRISDWQSLNRSAAPRKGRLTPSGTTNARTPWPYRPRPKVLTRQRHPTRDRMVCALNNPLCANAPIQIYHFGQRYKTLVLRPSQFHQSVSSLPRCLDIESARRRTKGRDMQFHCNAATLPGVRAFAAPVRCPNCDDWMIAPVVSEFVEGGEIRHHWECDACREISTTLIPLDQL